MTYDRNRLREELEMDEGYRGSAYQDTEGYWTIGFGRMIDARLGGRITVEEARVLLEHDLDRAEEVVGALEPRWRELPEGTQRALLNMAHNLGPLRLARFVHLRTAIGRYLISKDPADLETAAAEVLDSRYARQVGERANRVAALMRHVG